MPEPVERGAEAGEAAEQVRGRDGLERVAGGDAERHGQRLVRRRVGDERADEHTRPGLPAVQEQRREGEARRRPHQRDLIGREGHRKAELRRGHVNDGRDGSCSQR